MKNRYRFLKKIYRDYVVVFLVQNYYYVVNEDMFVLKFKIGSLINTLDYYRINYLVVDNLNIVKIQVFDRNRYYECLYKSLFIQFVTSLN